MRIRSLFLLALAVIICSPYSSWAEEASTTTSPKPRPSQGRAPWMGPKADTNSDGKISAEEAQAAQQKWSQMRQEAKVEAKQEWKEEKREQWQERKETIQEKKEEWREKKQEWKEAHPRVDKDNNPPGMAGGPGTNWENKPGPQGGPGSSPNAIGNPPGPVGGKGAGPRYDKDNNPPGKAGGPGASPNRGGGNPPGPKGGAGAGPKRK